ncbi:MAG: hypothetical protein ACD_69C00352G0002 [uncultured bacterium]|nr:MAG: hypothetical protein ACD_69C00352G0002 [uncultured bacterium]OGT08199.1 MAG: hypothetical protein A2V89_05315 [Gammaproteobacteria bacterium RBG_16_37_9]HBC71809.1 hypothetical protein [Coxiellaceae bacterium]HBS51762.1 hypothetical protein [Coxiellaceae bacterium]HBY56000.1 hypothetical protein [Coxiellaceae bacterium]
MSIFSKNPLTIKEIWITSLQLYRKVFTQVWYLGMTIGIFVTVSLLFNVFYGTNDTSSFKVAHVILPIFIELIALYLTSVILYRIYNIAIEQAVSLKDSMIFINKKYFIIASSMAVMFILSMLGTIAFILPGVFLIVLFAMGQPLILFDNQGIIGAIKGSCKLVWGNWWRTFALIFPLLFIAYWMSFSMSRVAATTGKWYFFASGNMLFAVLFYPLITSCNLVIFNDLKLRRKIREITTTTTPTENL